MNYPMTLTSSSLIDLAVEMAHRARLIDQQIKVRPGTILAFRWSRN